MSSENELIKKAKYNLDRAGSGRGHEYRIEHALRAIACALIVLAESPGGPPVADGGNNTLSDIVD